MVTRSVIGGEDRVLNRFLRGISLYLLIAIIVVTLASSMYSPRAYERELYYSELLRLIDQNQVASVRMIGDQQISGVLRDGTPFVSIVPMGKMSDIADRLEGNAQIAAEPPPTTPWWVALIPNIIFIVVLAFVWLFIMNQMQGGNNRALSFGKSRARRSPKTNPGLPSMM